MTQKSAILELIDVNKSFTIKQGFFGRKSKQVLNSVSFTVNKGETVALVGESGSGKSTTARVILGLESPYGGKVLFKGRDLNVISPKERRDLRKNLQVVFQDPYGSVNPRSTVRDIVTEPLLTHGCSKKKAIEEAVSLMEVVGLNAADLHKYPHNFSGGQMQRIGIARAIALRPELLILDEPTSALDVSVQARILKLLKSLQSELSLTYLFITHDLNVVQTFADRVFVMNKGEIVESGTVAEIFEAPQHPYTQILLNSNLLKDYHRQ